MRISLLGKIGILLALIIVSQIIAVAILSRQEHAYRESIDSLVAQVSSQNRPFNQDDANRMIFEINDHSPFNAQLSLLLLASALTAGALGMVYYLVVQPVTQVADASRALARGDFSTQLKARSDDEMGDMVKSFNRMSDHFSQQQRDFGIQIAEQLRQETDQQRLRDTVSALLVPILPVADGILVFPLMGDLDIERAGWIRRSLFDAVSRERAHTVLLDLTALSIADDQVADHLLRLLSGLQLLGTRTALCGMSAILARLLAPTLGARQEIAVYSTLSEALSVTLANPLPMQAV